ncbi:MAG: 30S ribosomal protein S12 methylthiotransferase RimO [Clostridia bacterium]|nr:30S ribosomal protein S12 methylthiotransferase RimO [Clostridia bacterium]
MSKNAKKIGFVSMGCAKNLMDTEVMLKKLSDAGYEITPDETEADVVIVNTCAFIESAKRESIDAILDLAYLKEHAKLRGIVVTGCLAERYREEVRKELPEADAVLGVGAFDRIVEAVDAVFKKETFEIFPDKESAPLGGERVVTTGEGMAYLKIAEGCNNRCAYCAIPMIRGRMRSRTVEDIVREAKDLDALGIRELVVVAQDTSAYGLDLYGRYALPELLRAITKETSIPWIRLLYCYPDKITDELVEEIATNDRIVKYLDMPVQHISDSVLKRMNRHGDSATIRDAISRLRKRIPGIVLRTTLIVGFPGETEEDFEKLCAFVREAKFERLGVFTYSREEDTPAYSMEDQIDAETASRRMDILMKEQLKNSERFNKQRIGKTVDVLVEGFDEVSEAYFGRTKADAPDIDGKVFFQSKNRYADGSLVKVRITEALDYDLVGDVVLT